ncbi:hypothetical protein HJC10_09775 [Corallococcus exiguus]|uniref:hypothetical protein n=1 Tax=Corallococcus TaxID=83461 RepID=UPI000EE2BEB2|nr:MULTISPECIES: hypothetical protein [Corallococcus]RYZ12912.1 MAG: hypothetical protein EOO70_08900 [Myxococcaceae bacterium]NNB92943.1 hypothetical protein [Corallococcus exiguus]NNC03133.1 hypothetical protein [Corallococcus exiguus]NPC45630.1 hypothetical protein [Corallococcus exiguus]RKH86266.1 hypothetical protein D7X99_03855 [Corallococcus sp. AB032C]
MDYDTLKLEIQKVARAKGPGSALSREQLIDWAYGTCVIENKDVTREMAEKAVDARLGLASKG